MRQLWSSFSVIQGLIFILMFLSSHSQGESCDSGWFGGRCQYKCHCTDKKCDDTGECADTSSCERGWFGPACQYVDLAATETKTSEPRSLTDGDVETCIEDQTTVTTSVLLNRPFPFTWLRLHVKENGQLKDVDVSFAVIDGSNTTSAICDKMRRRLVDAKTMDVHCQPVMIQLVNITGGGVKSLCSLHISGGRNVALKQNTTQTSTFTLEPIERSMSSNAVNGDTNSVFRQGSCTHTTQGTNIFDPNPTWSLSFSQSQNINRYVIYNRLDCCSERLEKFILTSSTKTGDVIFRYQDPHTEPLDLYTFTSLTQTSPISLVNITATTKDPTANNISVLTLCEVELYGDSSCPPGKYGRECEDRCNCAVENEECFVTTGGCPSGCAAGYQGENCHQACPSHYYGIDCNKTCGQNCADQLCNRTTGFCDQCVAGYTGDMCDNACPPHYYGIDCKELCGQNCADQLCNRTTGVCDECVAGYTGDMCDTVCGANTYGQDCRYNCSQFCKVEEQQASPVCYYVTGVCLLGCQDGYEGLNCDNPEEDVRKKIFLGAGVGVAAVVVVVVVVISVCCYRRKLKKANLNGTSYDELDFRRPDNHIYNIAYNTSSSTVSGLPNQDAAIPVEHEVASTESQARPAEENLYTRLYDDIESSFLHSVPDPALKRGNVKEEGGATRLKLGDVSRLSIEDAGIPANKKLSITELPACPAEDDAYTRLYDYSESNVVKSAAAPPGQRTLEKKSDAADVELAYTSQLPIEDADIPADPKVFTTEPHGCPDEEDNYTRLYDYCDSNSLKSAAYLGKKTAEKEDGATKLEIDDNHYVNTGIYTHC